MSCQRCGHCCATVYIGHTGVTGDDKREVGKYFEYHHCQIVKRRPDNGDEIFGVRIPLVCKHLSLKNGAATCVIYEQRPVMCKEYLCKRAKEE